MKCLIVGSPARLAEAQASPLHGLRPEYLSLDGPLPDPSDYSLWIHLNLDDQPQDAEAAWGAPRLTLLGCAVKLTLAEIIGLQGSAPKCNLLGFNALPGFLNRQVWEVSQPTPQPELPQAPGVSQLVELLGSDSKIEIEAVADRPGLVSARTVCMIINEANWMLDEAAAQAQAIDTAMRLGVNYPQGPLEWQAQIGTRNVVDVLAALGRHYGTDTYKISPRLSATYALSASF